MSLVRISTANYQTPEVELCQIENAQAAGKLRRPGYLHVASRILWNLKNHGLSYTFRTTMRAQGAAIRARLGFQEQITRTPHSVEAVLDLQPGELVQVKSLDEKILATLDSKGKHHGLVFTPEMKKHCGKVYRVYKRLELMFDENHKSLRRLRNTVLLGHVVCEGAGLGRDRSCFLYWREAWLRRVPGLPRQRQARQT